MKHILRFTPLSSDGMGKYHRQDRPTWLVNLGDPWPHRPDLRLISEVTTDPNKARPFATIAEATEVLALAGEPDGWTLEVVP